MSEETEEQGEVGDLEDPVLPKQPIRRGNPKPPKKQKEQALRLTNAQRVDIHIAILLGLGLKNAEEIGRKVEYSAHGVRIRRNGLNALLISEIENIVKHEINVSRKLKEHIAAEDLKKALGERASRILTNVDDALEARDETRRDKATFRIANHLLGRGPGRPRAAGDDPSEPMPSVYQVNIGSLRVLHQHVAGQPITLPDQAKVIDLTPVNIPIGGGNGERR